MQGGLYLLLVFLLAATPAGAEGFKVLGGNTQRVKDVYQLSAEIDYTLSEPALEALHNGVPLTIEIEMEVLRERWWMW